MDRIIGIDYGRKRTGLAVSDPLGIFATALETVPSAKIIDYTTFTPISLHSHFKCIKIGGTRSFSSFVVTR